MLTLQPPEAVRAATADYLQEEDSFSLWLAERCDVGSQYEDTIDALFNNWKDFTDRANEVAGKKKSLSNRLQDNGFIKKDYVAGGGRGFAGLKVKPIEKPRYDNGYS